MTIGHQPSLLDPRSGRDLERAVVEIGLALGLEVQTQVTVGRRLWGAERRIDIILTDRGTRRSLGIECKHQTSVGSAEEKIPATIEDIRAWPIPGLVCFHGPGFSPNMRSFLVASGKAVELPDLEVWLRLYFVL